MKEQVLSFEEECLLQDKLQTANKKLTWGAVCGFIIFFLILVIPQKYVPLRGSDFSDKSLLESGGLLFLSIMLLFGGICLMAFFADSRYFRIRKDIREKAKVKGMARILEINRAPIDAHQQEKRTLFKTDAPNRKYRTLYWLENNLYGLREGDTITFECGKYSGIVLRMSRI